MILGTMGTSGGSGSSSCLPYFFLESDEDFDIGLNI